MTNVVIDNDQKWLLDCLTATLDTNQQVRSFAEASLTQASHQPGFGTALCKVVGNREIPQGLRQLAAVLLKQFVKKHWYEGEDGFELPVVPTEEKEIVRRLLLTSLDDPHRKICVAVSMAVTTVAEYDWPEEWPDFMPFMLKLISDPTNMNGVHGALRCLSLLSGDLDDKAVPTLVPILFPCLHSIVSTPQIYDKSLRTRALAIVYSCTSVLGSMSALYKTETTNLMSPMFKSWMEQFAAILEYPVHSEDPDDWSMRMEVLKCLNQSVQNFPTLAEKEFMVIVGPLWQTFVSSLKVYEQSSVQGFQDPFDGRYDSDGSERSLESFVIQLLEFLLTVVGSTRFLKAVVNNLKELAYYTMGFLQMTEQQVHSWSHDANLYVADEDDNSYSCRISAILLLEEIVGSCGEAGADAIVSAAEKRYSESHQQKVEGVSIWWRVREGIIYALASLSEEISQIELSGSVQLDLKKLMEKMMTEDADTGVDEYPFLYARLFSSIAKFAPMISPTVIESYIFAAIKAIDTDVPPPVKIGACRALSHLLSGARKELLQPQMMQLFSSLTELLKQASEETLHLVLETLQAAVKSGCEATASVEPIISPIIFDVWASHVSDPFISIDAIEVLEAIKDAPGCIGSLVSRVLPWIGPVLSNPKQPEGLIAGSLDLITMLLKNAPLDVVKALFDVCFNCVIRIVLQSDDNTEMQNATECLTAFVSAARLELLAWGDPGFVMKSLLDALSRLLNPTMESSGSFFVGSFILQLILHLPSQMMQHIPDLVGALVRRMQSCEIAGLKNSLVLVFSRLVHASSPNIHQFIELLLSVPADDYDNSFVYVMSEWVKLQGEVQGAYQIKVTTTALALLLSTRHVVLEKINVQGHPIKSNTGIVTRSRAKLGSEQWTVMPLHAKILGLLSDALIEIQEQVLGEEDEDSDWEEVETSNLDRDHDAPCTTSSKYTEKPTSAHLYDLAKAFDNSQEDGDEDDLLSSSDPLNEINLAKYLVDFLLNFRQSDASYFSHIYQFLTHPQQKAIENILCR